MEAPFGVIDDLLEEDPRLSALAPDVLTAAARELRRAVRRIDAVSLRRRIARPIKLIGGIAKHTLRNGSFVRREHGVSIPRQMMQQLALCVRLGWWPAVYYKYKLHLPERRRVAELFVAESEALVLLKHINSREIRSTLDDKRLFAIGCARHGLPHIDTVAYFNEGRQIYPEPAAQPPFPRNDLIVKLTNSLCGRNVQRWRFVDDSNGGGYRRDDEGLLLTGTQLLARLRENTRPCIVQSRVINHAEVARLSRGGLCTVRIVTARFATGQPQYILAALRMPSGDACVDNFEAGGIAAPINRRTGRLGLAVSKNPTCAPMNHHPDTGAAIEGFEIPMWRESVELCLRAHRCFASAAAVGWDVAITPAGPVLVEANPNWCVELVQMTHGTPLGATPFTRMALSFLH